MYKLLFVDDMKLFIEVEPHWRETTGYPVGQTSEGKINFVDPKDIEVIDFNATRDAKLWILENGFPDILLLDEDFGYGIGPKVDDTGYGFVSWMIHLNENIINKTVAGWEGTDKKDITNIKHFRSISNYSTEIKLKTENLFHEYIQKLTNINKQFDINHMLKEAEATFEHERLIELNANLKTESYKEHLSYLTRGTRPGRRKSRFKQHGIQKYKGR
jgi:hypothetical protein